MSFVKEVSNWLLSGIGGIVQGIEDDEINRMVEVVLDAMDNKILLLGTGRSGFVGRAFALRLMHLGFNVYVSGETITPALTPDDLVLAISGSGTTTTVVAQAEVARSVGSKITAVTSHPDSPLAELSDDIVVVKGRTKIDQEFDYDGRQIAGEYDNAPLGTMFELSVMVFLDSVIAELMQKLGIHEIDLRRRHPKAV
ncbi:MAG: SIS domain-containing protein [Candidatus Bathyarchaeota archaeon]|nr:MAG: SIS domain-containing protein [Candidatus Bathyarchaeota archaeon]